MNFQFSAYMQKLGGRTLAVGKSLKNRKALNYLFDIGKNVPQIGLFPFICLSFNCWHTKEA
jgi:hypothetical protein